MLNILLLLMKLLSGLLSVITKAISVLKYETIIRNENVNIFYTVAICAS